MEWMETSLLVHTSLLQHSPYLVCSVVWVVRGDSQQQQHQHLYGGNAPIHTAGYWVLGDVYECVMLLPSPAVWGSCRMWKKAGDLAPLSVTLWRSCSGGTCLPPVHCNSTRQDGMVSFGLNWSTSALVICKEKGMTLYTAASMQHKHDYNHYLRRCHGNNVPLIHWFCG